MYRHFRHSDKASPLQPSNHACNTSNMCWQNCSKHQARQLSKTVAGGGITHAKLHKCRWQQRSQIFPPPSWVPYLLATESGSGPLLCPPSPCVANYTASLPEIETQALLFEDHPSFIFPLSALDAP